MKPFSKAINKISERLHSKIYVDHFFIPRGVKISEPFRIQNNGIYVTYQCYLLETKPR